MGWLHATPKSKSKKDKEERTVRARSLPKNSVYFIMPDVGIGKYIVDLWSEVGECKQGGMSIAPIDWVDVAAFGESCSVNHKERQLIISMSKEYVSAINRYDDQFATPPYCYNQELAKQQQREMLTEKRRLRMKAAQ